MAARNNCLAERNNPTITIEDDFESSNPFCTTYKFGNSNVCYEEQTNELEGILRRQNEVKEESVESIKRSKALLLESEVVGIKTAEDLVRQGEQLKRIDNKLDEASVNLQENEKNIRGIKSIFGEFKNYLSEKFRRSPSPEPKNVDQKFASLETSSASPLLETVNTSKRSLGSPRANHPGFKHRNLEDHSPVRKREPNPDDDVDEGLEDISSCLDRLKELSIGLGKEIDMQNEFLPQLSDKTLKTDDTIKTQNKQLSEILRK